jgi:hypothetical protein
VVSRDAELMALAQRDQLILEDLETNAGHSSRRQARHDEAMFVMIDLNVVRRTVLDQIGAVTIDTKRLRTRRRCQRCRHSTIVLTGRRSALSRPSRVEVLNWPLARSARVEFASA